MLNICTGMHCLFAVKLREWGPSCSRLGVPVSVMTDAMFIY